MTADYFAAFSLPRHFDLESSELEKRYFEQQRRFHPDRLTGKSPAERQQAISHSMLLNEAYETLTSPLRRAQHLLALHGAEAGKPSQALLMDIMERREALSEAESVERLNSLARENDSAKNATLTSLSHAFAQSDHGRAAQLAMQLSYLTKLEDEIRVKRKSPAA